LELCKLIKYENEPTAAPEQLIEPTASTHKITYE
jgi:hypothetical protein